MPRAKKKPAEPEPEPTGIVVPTELRLAVETIAPGRLRLTVEGRDNAADRAFINGAFLLLQAQRARYVNPLDRAERALGPVGVEPEDGPRGRRYVLFEDRCGGWPLLFTDSVSEDELQVAMRAALCLNSFCGVPDAVVADLGHVGDLVEAYEILVGTVSRFLAGEADAEDLRAGLAEALHYQPMPTEEKKTDGSP